jgi:hypothetical protein
MDRKLLADADRIVAQLSPGKRESVREIAIEASSRGVLSDRARLFLTSVTGSSLVADVLAAAVSETVVNPEISEFRDDGDRRTERWDDRASIASCVASRRPAR